MTRLSAINQQITNDVISAIKSGKTLPWRTLFKDKNSGSPANILQSATNLTTKKDYSGINFLILAISAYRNGYASRWYATRLQWEKAGAAVKDKQRATWIVFYSERLIEDDLTGEQEKEAFWKWYEVFNIEQVNGEHLDRYRTGHRAAKLEQTEVDERYATADDLLKATGADVMYQVRGKQPRYNPKDDVVVMPEKARCEVTRFYSVLFHELIHWTGHDKRLKRLHTMTRHGDDAYATEELVAEIGSAFTAARLGIPTIPVDETAAYLDHWLKRMDKDPSFVVQAAKAASRASNYLFRFITKPSKATPTDRSAPARKAWETRRGREVAT